MSRLLKRAAKRESIVQALAFDPSPAARKARLARTANSQWLNRVQRGEFRTGTKRTGAVLPQPEVKPSTRSETRNQWSALPRSSMIEWTLPNVDHACNWRDKPYEQRMVLIAAMAKLWAKTL